MTTKKDLDSKVIASDRRGFMKASAITATTMGIGFVAASEPVMAQAIETDFKGIKAGEQMIPVGSFQMPAYVSRPEKAKGNLPIVIVASEIFGVHEYIADVTRRFAKLGYMAIAPEFFIRAGDPNTYGTTAEIMSNIVAKTPDSQVLNDLQAAIQWAGKNGGDVKKVGVTGFCWGGRITWLSATLPQVKAGVAWYGRLVGEKTEGNPRHPVDIAADLKAPVLGLYGGADAGISLETVEQMRQALAAAAPKNPAAKASRFEVYPDAPHGFHADYRALYREGPAKDGWEKCIAWFKQNGVA
ncbi:MAG: carboxymethylenebutenolidase [Polynucleobacter sp. 24-46-87]|jgi:carboxymethylenebutenolidase|uniref:dienelactone hydrolase family protein n=1 Tax=unclassified Polynucleobacter TaxID=2640945 RepID=UPI000BD1E134|nr:MULTISPECIES: dienelactone hydrolase family protein [unclassified Polynucleobacter]OYY16684.1 MAG: carboxymethylenebutenolidase [Polynucleobacter sp. 35-46-11]OZA12713.1 MAG: carboxymethylenebutenolidase [Polynucleobacter sp. 24-46-87]OZA75533.1 MAG: carboxymethylenebutenolidase [Polynucleobacter sp. 39-46-10]